MQIASNLARLSAALAVGMLASAMGSAAHARDMTQTRLEHPEAEPDNWLQVNGDYSSHRYANLAQVTKDNVADLRLRMMVLLGGQTPAAGGRNATTNLEATPVVEDG